jgi:hypothetical protein
VRADPNTAPATSTAWTSPQSKAVDNAFDASLMMLVGPIVVIALIGAVLSLVQRRKKKPPSPYRTNARDA